MVAMHQPDLSSLVNTHLLCDLVETHNDAGKQTLRVREQVLSHAQQMLVQAEMQSAQLA